MRDKPSTPFPVPAEIISSAALYISLFEGSPLYQTCPDRFLISTTSRTLTALPTARDLAPSREHITPLVGIIRIPRCAVPPLARTCARAPFQCHHPQVASRARLVPALADARDSSLCLQRASCVCRGHYSPASQPFSLSAARRVRLPLPRALSVA